MLLSAALIFAKNGDENNPAVIHDCGLSPAVNLACELWRIVELWMTVNVEGLQLLRRNAALLQECNQMPDFAPGFCRLISLCSWFLRR